jgi:hypothetical protein
MRPGRRCDYVRILALVDQALADDPYASDRGIRRRTDGFEVTLTLAEGLRRAERRHSVPLDTWLHRRNLMLSGLLGTELRGRSLRIGEAPFEWHRVRPP